MDRGAWWATVQGAPRVGHDWVCTHAHTRQKLLGPLSLHNLMNESFICVKGWGKERSLVNEMTGNRRQWKHQRRKRSFSSVQFSSVQSLSRVWLFATPRTAARQASLSITNPRSSLRLMSIKSVMPSSHLILCHPLLLLPPIPSSIRVFSNESALHIRQPKYWGFSFNISPMNTQDGSPLGWTGWISLQSKGLSRVFSNTTVQKHQFFGTQLSSQSNSRIHTWPLEKT